jgi:hypothetical protein
MDRFWSKVAIGGPDECWPWLASGLAKGYGLFRFEGKLRVAHRVAFYLTFGRWPEPCGLHECDNPPCVNPAHIFEGTKGENSADMKAKGRSGGGCPRKLKDADIVEIFRLRSTGLTQRQIAKRLSVGRTTIQNIYAGFGQRTQARGQPEG